MRTPVRYGRATARIYGLLLDPIIYPLRRRIKYFCWRLPAHNVLDVACATGAQCRMLSRAGIHATGVDLSEAMIETAKRRGGERTRYVVGSALDLPFEDNSFDAVILSLTLHEHPEPEREIMVREAMRVLRPQGILILADYTNPTHPALHLPWQLVRLIENAAGTEHRAGFRDFIERGGLTALPKRFGIRRCLIHASHLGAIGILWTRKPSDSTKSPTAASDPL